MFDPEFRYLLTQEARNMENIDEELIPIDFALIMVFGSNILAVSSAVFIIYKLFMYNNDLTINLLLKMQKYMENTELFDTAIIIISMTIAFILFFVLKCMGDILEKGYTNLKNENKRKDEIIKKKDEIINKQKEVIDDLKTYLKSHINRCKE